MSSLVSTRVNALINKLRGADQAGQYFSGDDISGLIRELRSINDGVKSLEDDIVGSRRRPGAPPQPVLPPRAQAVGTFFFVPGEGRA